MLLSLYEDVVTYNTIVYNKGAVVTIDTENKDNSNNNEATDKEDATVITDGSTQAAEPVVAQSEQPEAALTEQPNERDKQPDDQSEQTPDEHKDEHTHEHTKEHTAEETKETTEGQTTAAPGKTPTKGEGSGRREGWPWFLLGSLRLCRAVVCLDDALLCRRVFLRTARLVLVSVSLVQFTCRSTCSCVVSHDFEY
ncbi:hypothetical protein NP493_2g19016 [Ridgeia piscesae]|uniref:Uncharacterized protein n=1 Tax=Ridgeia piscesae TaxID=27915 RepID=A0AAD9PGL8_RIDPI|nr:hypothetical protein NP493_2g19016 [Ridgeia piscesae]